MGMLQLAGAVSGLGKGLSNGLQTLQQGMMYSQLQQERNDMELKRLELTFGNERGMLRERLAGEAANNAAYAKTQNDYALQRLDKENANALARDEQNNSQAMDRLDTEQDFRAGQSRIERQFEREKAEKAAKAAADKAAQEKQDTIDAEKRKEQATIRSEGRQEKRDRGKRQEEFAQNYLLEKERSNGRVNSGAAKLDPQTNAQLNILKDRINQLNDEANNVMTTDQRRQQIQKEIALLQGQQNALVGMQAPQANRKPFVDPMQ